MAASITTFDFGQTKSKILKSLESSKLYDKVRMFLDVIESDIRQTDETDEANRYVSFIY